jgi:uncharacterized membrane protein YdjX (TVP38/TMEM64 family)
VPSRLRRIEISRRTALRLGVLIVVILVVSLVAQRYVDFDREDIEEAVDAAGMLAPGLYAIVLFLGLSVPFNPISDLATVSVAALVFEPHVSVAATFVAHTAALVVNYTVARRFGSRVVRLLAGRRASEVVARVGDRLDARRVFVIRFLLPLTAIGIDVVSYLSGLRRLDFARFYVASIVPWTLISVIFFYSTSFLREQSLVLFFLPVAVLVLVPVLILVGRNRYSAYRNGRRS